MNIELEIKDIKHDLNYAKECEYDHVTLDVYKVQALLTAYEKEKEKNNKLMEELDLTTVYISGVYDGEKKVEDKIKAKIEELNKEMLSEENSLELFYRKKYCNEVLQSLLEKE